MSSSFVGAFALEACASARYQEAEGGASGMAFESAVFDMGQRGKSQRLPCGHVQPDCAPLCCKLPAMAVRGSGEASQSIVSDIMSHDACVPVFVRKESSSCIH